LDKDAEISGVGIFAGRAARAYAICGVSAQRT